MRVITEWLTIDSIPALLFYPEDSENNPLVIFFHGFSNDKFEGTNIALKMSEKGLAVLCMDCYGQGERSRGEFDNISSDSEFGTRLFEIVEQSLKDTTTIISKLKTHKAIDSSRLGLVGFSHGANCVYYLTDKMTNVKSSVAILGAPDFEKLLTYAMEFKLSSDFKTDEEREVLEYVQKLNPYEELKHTQVPLLMINALNDDDVPYKIAQTLKTEDVHLNNKVELILEDGPHYIDEKMVFNAINWTLKHVWDTWKNND